MAINKQPVFTTTPILVPTILDPTIVGNTSIPDNYLSNSDIIFESTDSYGSLIERIIVSSTADPDNNPNVAAKLIYLYMQDKSNVIWSLYKTAAMPATTVSNTVPNAEIEWIFTGGIILPNDFALYIGASTNANTTGQSGDRLSITVEGSTYTAI